MNQKFLELDQIACLIVKSYDKGRGVFIEKTNLEDVLPKDLSDLEKALFLFYVTQIDYATNSKRMNANAAKKFNENKDFFSPKFLSEADETFLHEILKDIGPRYINEAVKRWKVNSVKLLDEYQGDPRKIFKNNSAPEVLRNILSFRGFGNKTGNFFFRTMVDIFNLMYPDLNEIEQPVDRHDIRLTWEWGFLENADVIEKNIRKVKKIWKDICIENDISWIKLDKAMWLIGAKGVRSGNFERDFFENIGLQKKFLQ